MKTIILSAGKGERLLPLTKDRPKILVELGDGSTLLSRQIEILFRHPEIDEIIIGAGHCVDRVDEFASEARGKGRISVIYNPFYGVSGPLVTLWVVLNRIDDPEFMFMNGDTLYSELVYSKVRTLLSSRDEGIFLLCSHAAEVVPDDIKVKLDKNNKVFEAGKHVMDHDAVSAGLMIIKGKKSSSVFRQALDKASRRDDFLNYGKTWHSFIRDLSDQKADIEPLMVDKSEWAEVDIHFEFEELKRLLKKRITFHIKSEQDR